MKKISPTVSFIAPILLIGYLFLSLFILLHMAHMNDMGMPMQHCPYMVGEQSLCQMNTFDHLTLWQQQFSNAVFPSLVILLFLIAITNTFLWYVSPPDPFLLYNKHRKQYFSPPLHQRLFSQGLLNPKPY